MNIPSGSLLVVAMNNKALAFILLMFAATSMGSWIERPNAAPGDEAGLLKFMTQSPVEPNKGSSQDCLEYTFGQLSNIRRHGAIWQNDVKDCSNCTCDNGEIRCFFHFCNVVSTSYMIPPSRSVKENASTTITTTFDEEENDLESSGEGPMNDNSSRPTKLQPQVIVDNERWRNNLVSFKIPSKQADPSFEIAENDFTSQKEDGTSFDDESETRNFYNSFCSKGCEISCLTGFEVDAHHGCFRCKCNACSLPFCQNKCDNGYLIDENGCQTCNCNPHFSVSSAVSDDDIVFSENENLETIGTDRKISKTDLFDVKSVSELSDNNDPFALVASQSISLSSSPNFAGHDQDRHQTHEKCNKTHVRGCLDGNKKMVIGATWTRGPCVTCICAGPGYSECNITQCPSLQFCPESLRFKRNDSCCSECRADIENEFNSNGASSRVDMSRLPLESGDEGRENLNRNSGVIAENGGRNTGYNNKQPYLLFILLPLGVVFSVGVLLFAHLWRRNHQDKYDISSYRSEEKQKLRPTKPPNEENSVQVTGSNLC